MLCDLHHHIIYGVDDGAPDMPASIGMLRRAIAQNISIVVCTSHDSPGEHALDHARYFKHLDALRKCAQSEGLDVRLYSGSEILYSPDTVRALRENRVITLGESRNVLIEFFPDIPKSLLERAAKDVKQTGYTMVLAHAERYACLTDAAMIRHLKKEYGVLIQINAATVLQSRALLAGRRIRSLLRENLVDIVASDAHGLEHRPCNLADAYQLLYKEYGINTADRLCKIQPAALVAR